MASGALFGAVSGRGQSKNLVEFKAGRMHLKGTTVRADKRKGLVYVHQSEDGLMHFCWKDRTTGKVDEDLIIFADDVEFRPVRQCTTGRVFVLCFKSNNRKMFFWMQEPKSDKDEEYRKKVNDYLNNPPPHGSGRSTGAPAGGLSLPQEWPSGIDSSELQSLFGNMNQQQLMQIIGGMGGLGGINSGLSALMNSRPSSLSSDSTPASHVQSPGSRAGVYESSHSVLPRPVTVPPQTEPSESRRTAAVAPSQPTATGGSASPAIHLSDLQNILSGLGVQASGDKESIDLATAVTPESMIPILANPQVQERLIPFLPEGETLPKTEEELRNTIQSPQFRQAMQSFSAALASGQLGPLMGQFGLDDEVTAAAVAGDVAGFAKALQESLARKEAKGDDDIADDADDDNDDKMQ